MVMDVVPVGLPIPEWLAAVLAASIGIKYLFPDFIKTIDHGLARRVAKSLGLVTGDDGGMTTRRRGT